MGVALAVSQVIERPEVPRARAYAIVAVIASALTLAAQGYAGSWASGHQAIRARRDELRRAKPCVLHAYRALDDCLRTMHIDTECVRRGVELLWRTKLGPFAAFSRSR